MGVAFVCRLQWIRVCPLSSLLPVRALRPLPSTGEQTEACRGGGGHERTSADSGQRTPSVDKQGETVTRSFVVARGGCVDSRQLSAAAWIPDSPLQPAARREGGIRRFARSDAPQLTCAFPLALETDCTASCFFLSLSLGKHSCPPSTPVLALPKRIRAVVVALGSINCS
jgi:hypothetical protein